MKITAETLLAYVRTQIGVKETPINQVVYNDWYYGRHVEGEAYKWCVTGPMYSFSHCGMPLPIKTASTTSLMNYAKKVGRFYTSGYKPGDIGFCTTKAGRHTFIIERVYENGLDTIEFNLDDQVKHNYRRIDSILGAYRPEYEVDDMTREETQKMINDALAAAKPDAQAMIDETVKRYKFLHDVPKWYRPALDYVIANGYAKGEGGSGETMIVNITEDALKLLTWLYRAGVAFPPAANAAP